jgi:hypothetical protein
MLSQVGYVTRSVLFMVLCQVAALSQTTVNGSLRGTVLDPSEARVVKANILLQNEATGFSARTQTGDDGAYSFGSVPSGVYRLSIEKQGFQRLERTGLAITVNQAAEADVILSVGEVATTVTVAANVEVVQTQSTEISGLVDQRRVQDLPLNGKNFNRLTFLAPGAQGGTPNNPAISGARSAANTYTIDGANTSDERTPNGISNEGGAAGDTYGGAGANLISTEAIQEFRVITTGADATFGRGSGGQLNIVTKSGSNSWRGSAYEYLRNNALDARNSSTTDLLWTHKGGRSYRPSGRISTEGLSVDPSGAIGVSYLGTSKVCGKNCSRARQRVSPTQI